MTDQLCPHCGTQLKECVNGLICPNHGLIVAYGDGESEEDKEKHRSYLG